MSKLQTAPQKKGGNTTRQPPPPPPLGNQRAAGHGGPGWLSQFRTAMADAVKPEDFGLMLMAQIEKAMGGDTAAFLAVRDTIGLKPKEEVQATVATILDVRLQAALIEVDG